MKLKKLWIVSVLLPVLVFCITSCAEREPTSYWVVLYAFSNEGELLHSRMTATQDTTWAGRRISVGFLEGESIILTGSGVGTTNATITLQYILDHYSVQGILFTGICGGISEDHKIGDIVIPHKWVTHDYGYVGPEGFQPDSIGIGRADQAGFSWEMVLPVDSSLHDWVCQAAYAAAEEFKPIVDRVVQVSCGGVGVTGNQFIDQVEKRTWLAETFDADITDMESSAVLQTALANGIPCVIIRSASDLAGGSGSATAGNELSEFFQIAADNSAAVVTSFFRMLREHKFEIREKTF